MLLNISTEQLPIIKVIYIIKTLITWIMIIIPIILVLLSTIDLIKALVSSDDTKKIVGILTKRIICTIMVFLVIPIVNLTMELASQKNITQTEYWVNSNADTISYLEDLYNKEQETKKKAYEEQKKKLEEEAKKKQEEEEKLREEAKRKHQEQQESQNNQPNYNPNPTDSTKREQIVNFALQYVGNRYVWGGNSLTNGVDCSGFTQQVYKNFGININRTAATQSLGGTKIELSNLKKGDLVFYGKFLITHVAMYIGDNKVVHAKGRKWGIVVDNMYYGSPVKAVSYINE